MSVVKTCCKPKVPNCWNCDPPIVGSDYAMQVVISGTGTDLDGTYICTYGGGGLGPPCYNATLGCCYWLLVQDINCALDVGGTTYSARAVVCTAGFSGDGFHFNVVVVGCGGSESYPCVNNVPMYLWSKRYDYPGGPPCASFKEEDFGGHPVMPYGWSNETCPHVSNPTVTVTTIAL